MRYALGQPPINQRIRLYSRTARRALHRYGLTPFGLIGPLDRRAVFVVGCPRSGTTFTASALGNVRGFVDLGEVNRLKAAIPDLYLAAQRGRNDDVVKALRKIVSTSQRVAMAARRRAIEQTPEATFLIPELARAFPDAHFIQLLRDGRDVVSSLVERGWLAGDGATRVTARATGEAVDDAGHAFGGYARFWVERGREVEFENADEARRCAWAWRRYVTSAMSAFGALEPDRATTVRYEDLVADPARVAARLATDLMSDRPAEEFANALAGAHGQSVGKHAQRLSADQIATVIDEAGPLLAELGYLPAATAGGC